MDTTSDSNVNHVIQETTQSGKLMDEGTTSSGTTEGGVRSNFIKSIIEDDLKTGKVSGVITRFPPEPNGFLHLGHAKSLCLNFGLANEFKGRCHLRFDDTNPSKEEHRYIESIQRDVKWLGFDWGEHLYYASDYFDQLFDWAVFLIKKGLAYVDEQTEEEVKTNRGDVKTPGTNSRFRDRPMEESLDMFAKMKRGEFPDGHCVLRAKIDMAHGNMNMRDPLLYRIKHCAHPRTGDTWCIYPIYDFAHGQSDSLEKITHSICTLEFYDHRMLYDWFQDKLEIYKTRQIEFARLNTTHTVMSKRKLLALVNEKFVRDWDDPRMPTISGMRRRGIPPAALRDFCDRVGVAKRANVIPLSLMETCVRDKLHSVERRMAIIRPLRIEITNFEEQEDRVLSIPNHPENVEAGTRPLHFSKHIWIDESDFMETPSAKFFRLSPGTEVRLKYAYCIKCDEVVKDSDGRISLLKCSYDASTFGKAPEGRKVKGVIHWLSESDACDAEVRLYDNLFTVPNPEDPDSTPDDSLSPPTGAEKVETEKRTWRDVVNPKSLEIVTAKIEKGIADSFKIVPIHEVGRSYQFERVGFFVEDPDSQEGKLVFNKTAGLQDSYAATAVADSAEALKKEEAKRAREKAAMERQKTKDERARKAAEKLKS